MADDSNVHQPDQRSSINVLISIASINIIKPYPNMTTPESMKELLTESGPRMKRYISSDPDKDTFPNKYRNESLNYLKTGDLEKLQRSSEKSEDKKCDCKADQSNACNCSQIDNEECYHPEYVVFTWIMCLVALATTLKLYYLIKTFLAIIMAAAYALLIAVAFDEVFNECLLHIVLVSFN